MSVRSLYLLPLLLTLVSACQESVQNARLEPVVPSIYPDYVGVTVPVNIAPLDFCMSDEEVQLVDAVVTDAHGNRLHGQGVASTSFDAADWMNLLSANVGDSLQVVVSAKKDGQWTTYSTFCIYVSSDSIDYGIAYRLIEPGYEVFSKMGIYECRLSDSRQRALLENTEFQGCVNCHSFNRGNTSAMSLHVRGPHGATLLTQHDAMVACNTATSATLGTCVYPYWHPSGRYIAYSTNTTRQVFHICDPRRIEVFDSASDLQVYDTETNELIVPDVLKQDSVWETFPAFSADGRTLYFCAAKALPQVTAQLDSVRYCLCSISFNPENGTFGSKIDTLIDAPACGKSVSMPRPSYDGHHLVYTLADYGQFPIWHHEADLYIVDTDSLGLCPQDLGRNMTSVNSQDTESYHSWSSNSRWLVFSSRRDDGLFTRPYFVHVDVEGRESKPFMLPQSNPRHFYRNLFMSYNVPEFITSPVPLDHHEAARLINDEYRKPFGVRGVDATSGASPIKK